MTPRQSGEGNRAITRAPKPKQHAEGEDSTWTPSVGDRVRLLVDLIDARSSDLGIISSIVGNRIREKMDIDPRPGKPFYVEVLPHQIELVERPIQIDPEFKSLIPPLGASEREQLESNLLAEGCRDPLVVWKGRNILLDGHNRYEICTSEGIEFSTVSIDLPDRDAALDWIIRNQLGRRNLTPEAVSYFRGKLYNSLKAKVSNPRGRNQHSEVKDQNDPQPHTADSLASEYKVGSGTIKRDAQYASAVDTLAEVVGEEVRRS